MNWMQVITLLYASHKITSHKHKKRTIKVVNVGCSV